MNSLPEGKIYVLYYKGKPLKFKQRGQSKPSKKIYWSLSQAIESVRNIPAKKGLDPGKLNIVEFKSARIVE